MTKITYEQFLSVLSKYDKFDSTILNAIYNEFGKDTINNYFERYFEGIDEEHIDEFISKYEAYFEAVSNENDVIEVGEYDVNGFINLVVHRSYKYPLMSFCDEQKYGLILKEGIDNLKIINPLDDFTLYPKLNLAKLFLSVKNEDDVELISMIKKMPFSYDDASIFKEDLISLKKYIKLCKNGVPSLKILKKEFSNLNFSKVKPVDDLSYQCDLLKRYIDAKYNFYNRNLRLVIAFAKRFCKGYNFDEKLQEGCFALIKAINKYDSTKNYKFSTYATHIIVQNICRYVANNKTLIRKPVYLTDAISKYNRFVSNYITQNGVEPTFEECLNYLGFSEDRLKEVQREVVDVLSLDMSFAGDEAEDDLITIISDASVSIEDDIVSKDFIESVIKEICDLFEGREREILLNRLELDDNRERLTLEELGACYGITRERVRQIEKKNVRILIKKLKNKGMIEV